MITEYKKEKLSNILHIINDAALKYKGAIPDDCYHEPYMSDQELMEEFSNGVRMFGYTKDDKLVGVMGIQELRDVTLIRHAYILTNYQRSGIGKLLLQYLFDINNGSRLLVGTWEGATWAVEFYLRNGFVLYGREQTDQLLNKYWQVPVRQMENSVVLEKQISIGVVG